MAILVVSILIFYCYPSECRTDASRSFRFVTDRLESDEHISPPKQRIFGSFRNGGELRVGEISVNHSCSGKTTLVSNSKILTTEKQFFDDIANTCREAKLAGKQPYVLVYTHGFNSTFSQAIRSLDSLNEYFLERSNRSFGADKDSVVIPILYSWPSMGSKYAYMQDECSLEWSFPRYRKFIDDLSAVVEPSTINLVAHSLGNRLVFLYLSQQRSGRAPILGTAIMASPDIDFATADEYKFELGARVKHLFVLVSNKDKPLIGSRSLHGYARLGRPSLGPVRALWLDQFRTGSIPNIVATSVYFPLLLLARCGYREKQWIRQHRDTAPDWISNSTLIDFTNIDNGWEGHTLCSRLIIPLLLTQKIPFDERDCELSCNSPDYFRMCNLFPPRIYDPLKCMETAKPYKIVYLKKSCRNYD